MMLRFCLELPGTACVQRLGIRPLSRLTMPPYYPRADGTCPHNCRSSVDPLYLYTEYMYHVDTFGLPTPVCSAQSLCGAHVFAGSAVKMGGASLRLLVFTSSSCVHSHNVHGISHIRVARSTKNTTVFRNRSRSRDRYLAMASRGTQNRKLMEEPVRRLYAPQCAVTTIPPDLGLDQSRVRSERAAVARTRRTARSRPPPCRRRWGAG